MAITLFSKDISMTRALMFLNVVLVTLLSSGCSSSDSSKSVSSAFSAISASDTVNFIGHWLAEGKREDLVRDVAREYEFANQDVCINLKFPDDIYMDRSDPMSNQKFVASIVKEANPKWDVIMINNEYQAIADINKDPNWAKNSLVDFSEIPEFRNNTMPALLSDSIKRVWGGIIPGPFIEGVNWVLWCNVEVAKKVGIKVNQFDMTYENFLSYIKAVDDYNKRNKDTIVAIYEASDWKTTFTIGSQIYASELNNSSEFFDTNLSDEKLNAWSRTLQKVEELSSYKPLSKTAKPWDVGQGLMANKCLFFSNGSWMYNMWTRSNMKNIVKVMPCEYPTVRRTDVYIGAYQVIWAVLKKAKNKDKAIDFLLKWNTTSVAERWANDTKCPTGIKESFSSSSFGSDDFSLFTKHINVKYGSRKYACSGNSLNCFGFKNKDKPNYFNEVLRGEMSANEAMRKIRAQLGR